METKRLTRWMVLFAVVLNISFNYVYPVLLPGSKRIDELSQLYYNHFTPAGYVFSIWGLIYLSFIVYAVYQLLPGQKNMVLADKLAMPLIAVNVLGMAWIFAFTANFISTSLILIFGMLLLAFNLFSNALKGTANRWLHFPFSIFFAWLCVANLAAFATWMVYQHHGMINNPNITDMLIAIAGLAGILVSLRYKDLFYPAVICWAVAGIYNKNKYMVDKVATVAFIAAIILFVWIAGYAVYLFVSSRNTGSAGKKPEMLND